jgi:hypothetical protein
VPRGMSPAAARVSPANEISYRKYIWRFPLLLAGTTFLKLPRVGLQRVRLAWSGGVVSVPGYYGDEFLVIKVDPDMMCLAMLRVLDIYGPAVADSVDRIVSVWNGLKLGWVGNTVDEAQVFNDEWNAAMSKMFGTQDDPGSGILSRIGAGVLQASVNYGEAEAAVVKMFREMSDRLNAAGDGGGDPSRHLNDGPVTENT